ncbi:MAG: DNA-directed RNA polymerase subunit P [Candidatus Woesearchaeota archaeon]
MADYKCFECSKQVPSNLVRRRVRCPYCGSKILFKPRTRITKVTAL